MILGFEPHTVDWGPEDTDFKFKQEVHLENTAIYKCASPETKLGYISGRYYIKNPRPARGYVKIAASLADCDNKMDTLWYVKASDLVRLLKRGSKDNG
jgi:hypothetical protein